MKDKQKSQRASGFILRDVFFLKMEKRDTRNVSFAGCKYLFSHFNC